MNYAAKHMLVGALLLCTLGLIAAGDDDADRFRTDPVPWLSELRGSHTRETGYRARLQFVTPGEDGWLSERYDEEIEARLKEFVAALVAQPRDAAKLAAFFAPEFRGTPLTGGLRTVLREAQPTVEQIERTATDRTVDAASFVVELENYLRGFPPLERGKFKVISIELNPADDSRAKTRVWYDLVGRAADGAAEQRNGHWEVEWRRGDHGRWLLSRLVAESETAVRTAQAYFADVTAQALPAGSAAEQLSRGLEYWTLNLDAAFLMSQEGHHGLAVADVDGDGFEDFYVAQPAGLPNRLFRNRGDGTFEDISAAAGVDVADRTAAPLFFDYDNDGDADLLLLLRNGPVLFRNESRGAFTALDSHLMGLARPRQAFNNPMSACAADYNNDGWLDFYVTSYQLQYSANEDKPSHPTPYHDARNGPPNFLYRNNGDGTFTETTTAAGLDENNNRFSFACAWGDYDRDGHPDLYVANDFGRNNLYRNNGDGTFRDVAAEAGVEDLGAGMSVAWEDYDNDGWLDLYVGNMWSSAGQRVTTQPVFKAGSPDAVQASFRRHAKGNTLFRNRGDGTFEDVTESAGVALGRWAWSSGFLDFDRDGCEDIFIANGFLTNESPHDL